MQEYTTLRDNIFALQGSLTNDLILQVYDFQYRNNPVYRRFVDLLGRYPQNNDIASIPFLPVELFKTHKILADGLSEAGFFESSGTTGVVQSRHYISDFSAYDRSWLQTFRQFYGDPEGWVILGLLPSYLERRHASLVYMVDGLMKASGRPENDFFLNDLFALSKKLRALAAKGQQVMLWGVTFALLDFAEQFPGPLPNVTIMETGGMKGRRKELTREELHITLSRALQPKAIHSEYGMTEMLSQAYSTDAGIFRTARVMKVLRRDLYNPLHCDEKAGRGLINVIDLANLQSCSFLATQDIGEFFSDGSFKVLGRSDNSDVRGCNLLVEW